MSFEIDGLTSMEVLGRGGFGTVYRATDLDHGRDVAVKVLPPIDGDSARRRFDRERRAMGTLSGHPSIGIVHTSGFTKNNEPYIVMEMLTGGSYGDLLEAGPIDADAVVELGMTLSEALGHAHRGGVLHLDLKPENILRSEYGRPKIVDFGIASLMDDDVGTTTIRATPAFADPEVLDGRPGTEQSDVYGLAATLYTLLNGEAPYSYGDTGAYSIMRRVAVDDVPRLERADVPPALSALLYRSMSKDPAGRPANMAEFREALSAIADDSITPPRGIPVVTPAASATIASPAPPAGPAAPPPQWSGPTGTTAPASGGRGRTVGLVLIGLAAVLLIGIAAVVLGGGDDDGDSEPDASSEVTVAEGTLEVADPTTPPVTEAPTTVTPTTAAPTTAAPTTAAPTTAAPTTAAPTTAAPTTAAPTTVAPVPPSPVIATNPRFSLQTNNGFPDPEVFAVPDGATQLCLTWDYQGFDPGAGYVLEWWINGELAPEATDSGINQGAVAGTFFGCLTNPTGVASGIIEVDWSVENRPVFSHGIFVGGGRVPVTVGLQNNTGSPICGAHWMPLGSRSNGITRNTAPIAPGQFFSIPLATGVYTTRVLDCNGNVIFDERNGTEFADNITLTLPL